MVTQPQVQKTKGTIERRKLTIISAGRVEYWGDHNLPSFKFRAGEGDREYTFEIFNRPGLIAVVRNSVGRILECDVETMETENGFTDRKIKQVYIDGDPVEKQEREGWGGYRGKSPEDRLSIERQTCLRCACDIFPAGTTTTEDILLSAEKMSGGYIPAWRKLTALRRIGSLRWQGGRKRRPARSTCQPGGSSPTRACC